MFIGGFIAALGLLCGSFADSIYVVFVSFGFVTGMFYETALRIRCKSRRVYKYSTIKRLHNGIHKLIYTLYPKRNSGRPWAFITPKIGYLSFGKFCLDLFN